MHIHTQKPVTRVHLSRNSLSKLKRIIFPMMGTKIMCSIWMVAIYAIESLVCIQYTVHCCIDGSEARAGSDGIDASISYFQILLTSSKINCTEPITLKKKIRRYSFRRRQTVVHWATDGLPTIGTRWEISSSQRRRICRWCAHTNCVASNFDIGECKRNWRNSFTTRHCERQWCEPIGRHGPGKTNGSDLPWTIFASWSGKRNWRCRRKWETAPMMTRKTVSNERALRFEFWI